MTKAKDFVVVTTDNEKRGAFGGTLVKHDTAKGTAILKDAHMAVFWSKKTKGVLGLAAHGPLEGSRITPKIPEIELNGVTAVMKCTEAAKKKWRKEPWD